MAEQSDFERTEPASPRRLEQAREEGQVARSQELTTFVMLMAGGGGLWLLGGHLLESLRELMRQGLRFDVVVASDITRMGARLNDLASGSMMAMAPILGLLLAAAVVAPQLLSGWNFSANALRMDLNRLDPVAGIGRLMSWRGAVELAKALLKSVLIAAVAAGVVWYYREALFHLVLLPPAAAIGEMLRMAGVSFLVIGGVLALVAAADVPFQLWRHADELKMSHQELRLEHKESEGDPQIKAAIRNQQRAMARRRMMAEVPKASVIVTNPTHYAVALKYDEGAMRAPQVVAKGADLVAARIRELGEQHRVPVVESPALARAIYRHAEIGEEIPETLYTAVAETLAYVFQLKRHRELGELAPPPLVPVAVPPGLDPQEGVR
jgi:flagellar biosynthesis protein FlhB